jgi:sugar/nucleoside kinase (ribokinase family)
MSESDAPRPRELALELASEDRNFALTEGGRGARVYARGRCFRVPAFRCPELEPTGAGDVFAASFLVALGEGQEPLDAAQFAACAASFAVEAPGVAGVFENRAEVEARLADYRTRYHPQEIEP